MGKVRRRRSMAEQRCSEVVSLWGGWRQGRSGKLRGAKRLRWGRGLKTIQSNALNWPVVPSTGAERCEGPGVGRRCILVEMSRSGGLCGPPRHWQPATAHSPSMDSFYLLWERLKRHSINLGPTLRSHCFLISHHSSSTCLKAQVL